VRQGSQRAIATRLMGGRGAWPSRLALGLLFASAVAVMPRACVRAQAQGADAHDPKALFERGVADYAAGQYAAALASFQEAFRLRPHPLVNVNIANCYDKLGKPREALFHFQRFLESDAGTPVQRGEVKAAVERLKQQIGKLNLRITPDGALAILDSGEQRKAPILDPVQLEAGKHTIEVRLEGYKTVERTLNVRGGATLELSIALEPETAAAPIAAAAEPALVVRPAAAPPAQAAAEPAPAEAAPPGEAVAPETAADALDREVAPPARSKPAAKATSGMPTRVWIAGGVTLTLAAAGMITGLLALSANSDFEEARSARFAENATGAQRLASYDEARDAASRANALALTTDILLVGSLVGAVTTVYLIADARADARRARRMDKAAAPHTKPSASLTPLLSPRIAGMRLRAEY
jgi:tetratricopeptide (TPR) repeat protein